SDDQSPRILVELRSALRIERIDGPNQSDAAVSGEIVEIEVGHDSFEPSGQRPYARKQPPDASVPLRLVDHSLRATCAATSAANPSRSRRAISRATRSSS